MGRQGRQSRSQLSPALLCHSRESGNPAKLVNRQSTAPSPNLSPESPQGGRSEGRGKIDWNADPGRHEGFVPLVCPGLLSDALTGLPRGSSGLLPLHFSRSIQSSDFRSGLLSAGLTFFRGNDENLVFGLSALVKGGS